LNNSRTLLDVLHSPDQRTAIVLPGSGVRITRELLLQQVLAMADALASAGVRRGDRVAIALPNGLPAIITFLAASIAGTAAPLNPAYAYEEFLFFLGDTNARILLCPPSGAESARRAAAERKIPVFSVEATGTGSVSLAGASGGGDFTEPGPDDIALILHTSGSTGRPKRVPLRHEQLAISCANIASSYALSEDDISLCIMPLFHVHGLMASTMATLLSGGTVVVPDKFNALSFWRTVKENRVTWYSGVPTMHQLLMARTREKPPEAATLRFIRSCSAAMPEQLFQRIEGILDVPLLEAYGMTEAAHQMSTNPLPPKPHKAGSVGLASGIRISIMDKEGNHLKEKQRGEVVIQGDSVFRGYEGNPEANASAFSHGWFRTGDEGELDAEGYLHLKGRIKDIIIRGGENISPQEVDDVLLRHAAVATAVTFGYAHPTLGEEVAAAVILREAQESSEQALLKHCREYLVEYKCPKKIYLVKSLPTTATGKVRRREVGAALVEPPR